MKSRYTALFLLLILTAACMSAQAPPLPDGYTYGEPNYWSIWNVVSSLYDSFIMDQAGCFVEAWMWGYGWL